MKTLTLTAHAALLLASCASQKNGTSVPVPVADNSNATALYDDVNRYRHQLGKPPIPRHDGLDSLARQHSEDMLRNRGKMDKAGGNLTHAGFGNRADIARTKYKMQSFHENVAYGSRGTSITRSWALSKPHERAMRGKWDYTGVGVAVGSDGTVFATQLFGLIGN